MHIKRLSVRNFRGLERISLEAGPGLNVIAGPNAVGKTTVLESIRLAKSLLAQRFNGEAQQVLASLGSVQHGMITPDAMFMTLPNNPNALISIALEVGVTANELAVVRATSSQIAIMMLQTELARGLNQSPIDLAQYLSTLEGQRRLQEAQNKTNVLLNSLNQSTSLNITADIDARTGGVRGVDANSQIILTHMEQSLPPNQTLFNYFPADRALPTGEVPIQLGAVDIQQQIMSYLAQPTLKYGRVKQFIIQTVMFDEHGRQRLSDEFNLIFDKLLPGKRLSGVRFNEHGMLRVLVEDIKSSKVFDMDNMSSGEKGLVLTFLMIRLSSKENSVVMLDEPELHLNAAVCTRIVKFLNEHCVEQKGLQLFVCSHSPEVVRDAFEDQNCRLFHLRSSADLSPVLQQDSAEVFEILNRLGNSTADVLFTRGAVFVEGEHDSAILQAGFADVLLGYKTQALGGRSEVEKEIPRLQALEQQGRLEKNQLFIFDADRKTSKLQSTELVKVYQLERYCIENYLLDETILFDIISENAKNRPESRGSFSETLEHLALGQLDSYVVTKVYQGLEPDNAGIRPKEIHQRTFEEASEALWVRIQSIRDGVAQLDATEWKASFLSSCETMKQSLEPQWRSNWKALANGKQIIDDLYAMFEINMKKVDFKRAVMARMAEQKTDTWRVLYSVLSQELQ